MGHLHVFVFVSFLLMFCSKDVLCEIRISQSPNPAYSGQYVTVTCSMNMTTAPIVVDWMVQATDTSYSDSFTTYFSSCQYIGAARPYTPRCSIEGTIYMTSMIISPANEDDNGNQWSCTTSSSGMSDPIALDVQASFSPQLGISQSPKPAVVGQDVTLTCTAIDYYVPYLIDWTVGTDSFSVYFATCSYAGAARAYTLTECKTDGFTYTASMVISSATKSDNGNQWSCTTASAGQSETMTIAVNAKPSISRGGHAWGDGLHVLVSAVVVVVGLIIW